MIDRLISIFIIVLLSASALGQKNGPEIIVNTHIAIPSQIKELKLISGSRFQYSTNLRSVEVLEELWNWGFLESYIDTSWAEKDKENISICLGPQYLWYDVRQLVPFEIRSTVSGLSSFSSGDIISLTKFQKSQRHIISELANHGYPMAELRLDSVRFRDSLISGCMVINPGERIMIDSLVMRSSQVVHEKVLMRIAGLKKGEWYSPEKVLKAKRNLSFSGIISDQDPIELGLFKDKAWLYIRPKKQKSNRIDGIVGLVPFANSGVPRLSGEFNLHLSNAVKRMETFDIKWRAPGNGTQKLNTGFALPYFLLTPVGLSGQLELYKKDTSYLNLGAEVGARISSSPGIWIELLYENRQSSQLSEISSSSIREFSLNMTKLNWQIDKRDSRVYPNSGWMIQQESGYGIKNMPIQNEESALSSYYEFSLNTEMYVPIYKAWSAFIGIDGGYRSGDLADNEEYKIGGTSLLRGFQEEQFLTGAYILSTIELRYSFSQASNIHLFIDGGWMLPELFPYSPGIGLSLETRAGILSLDYSLGQLVGETFSLQSGLIHLGIKSNF